MGQHTAATHCHCGIHRQGSDHCPVCLCEEHEGICDYVATVPAEAVVEFDKVVSDQTAYGLSYFDAPSVDDHGDVVATLWYPVDCPVDIIWSEGVWTLCD